MKNRLMEGVAQPAFVLMWSSAFIVGIIGVGAAPPMVVLFARYAFAGPLLVLYGLAVHAVWPRGRELRHVIVAGLLMQIVQFGAFYTAMGEHVPAVVIALMQGLNPVVIALFSGVLGEHITRRQWIGFGIGGIGVALAVSDQSAFSWMGLLLCVIGLLGLSLGTVYQKKFTPTVDSRAATAVHQLASAPFAAVLVLLSGNFHISDPGRFGVSLTWMVLMNSMGAFLLLNAMLRRWDATRVGKLFFATPVTTAVLAWLVIAQPLHPLTIAGLGVGVIGMVLASRKAPAAPAQPEPAAQPEVAARPARTMPDVLPRLARA
ncbi:DMT family transporter [Nocardia sp. NBC_01327]|uniref:DMT family transporter n=1 Tax=Nocardia sp. NBC_01327 TaxID=2903593 RepID=UPI002E10D163|nr:DMT family transporter [Nocardia sp. NBC_01327]